MDDAVRLIDYASADGLVEGKLFARKVILGPAFIFMVEAVWWRDCEFGAPVGDPDSLFWIEDNPRRYAYGCMALKDCTFEECVTRNIGIVGTREAINRFRQDLGLPALPGVQLAPAGAGIQIQATNVVVAPGAPVVMGDVSAAPGGSVTIATKIERTIDGRLMANLVGVGQHRLASLLAEFEQALADSDLAPDQQRARAAELKAIGEEAASANPDRSRIRSTLESLRSGLGGVVTLAEFAMKVQRLLEIAHLLS